MKIFLIIVIIAFAFVKIVDFFEKKQKNKRIEKKQAFKKQITDFTYKFLQPLVSNNEKYQLYYPIPQDKIKIYTKLLREEFDDNYVENINTSSINNLNNLDIIKEYAKTNKIYIKSLVLKEVRTITGLELKEALELVDEILMLSEMPTDTTLIQIINSVNTEKLQEILPSEKWSVLDSQNLLNDMFFEILFKKFIKQFAEDNPNCTDDWSSIKECYVRTFDNNTDYLIFIEHYTKIKNIQIPTNLENSIDNYIDELALEEQTNKYKQLIDNNEKLIKNNIVIEDIDGLDGFAFEHLLGALFKQMNYKVEVTKGSGDQGADIIISKMGRKTVVQAKCYLNNVSNKAVQEVVAAMKFYNADAGMVVTNSYYTKGAIELAEANNIALWDRDKLAQTLLAYPVVLDEIK